MQAIRLFAITGASLYSRVATLGLFVLLSHALSVADFGIIVVLIGFVVALSNVFSGGAADAIASQAVRQPARARRTITVITLASNAVALPAAVGGYLTNAGLSVALSSVALAGATASSMCLMHYLRGADKPFLGAVSAFILPPSARAVAVALLLTLSQRQLSLTEGYNTLTWASVFASLVSLLFLWSRSVKAPRPDTVPVRKGRKRAFALAAVLIALTWLTLGQYDILALTWAEGPESAGLFVPTMRMFEALTAIGIAYKFVSTRTLVTSVEGKLPFRPLASLFLLYAGAATLVFVLGPLVVQVFFGERFSFLFWPGVLLVGAYWFSILSTIHLQVLIARGEYRAIARSSLVTIIAALALMPVGASLFGAVGVSAASLLLFLAWFLQLRGATAAGVSG